jgi:hypothetical protein
MALKACNLNTPARDNHGYSYAVSLRQNTTYDVLVLHLEGAPGGWSVQTLLPMTGSVLAIDAGQRWNCINIQEILSEIKALKDASKTAK